MSETKQRRAEARIMARTIGGWTPYARALRAAERKGPGWYIVESRDDGNQVVYTLIGPA